MTQVRLDWSSITAEPATHADVFRLSRHSADVVLDIGAVSLHDLTRAREGDDVAVLPVYSVRLSSDGLKRLQEAVSQLTEQPIVTVLPSSSGPAN